MNIWYKIKRLFDIVRTEGTLIEFAMRTYPDNMESEKIYSIRFKVTSEGKVIIIYNHEFTKMMKNDLVPIIEKEVQVHIAPNVYNLKDKDIYSCALHIKSAFHNLFYDKKVYRKRGARITY